MTVSKRRIPTSPVDFNSFLELFITMITAGTETQRGVVLGLLAEEITAMQAYYDSWKLTFPLYTDKANSRTKNVVEKVHQTIQDFCSYDMSHSILTRIGSSPVVTLEELELCNIHTTILRKSSSPKVNSVISTQVVPELRSLGVGQFQVICNNTQNSSTAIIPEATAVEYCYQIGGEAPSEADVSTMFVGLSTRARFKLDVPQQYAGEKIYLYFRWINSRYPEYNAVWGIASTAIIH